MSVEEKVKEIIVDQLGVDENQVKPEASFIDDLGADSLDTVELVMLWKKNLTLRFLMKMQKRLLLFKMQSIILKVRQVR